jgi:hypothetical protein
MLYAFSNVNLELAHTLCSLAVQAYWYESFEPWAKAQGFVDWYAFHEDSLQAKLIYDGDHFLLVFAGTDTVNLKEWCRYDFNLKRIPLLSGKVHKGFYNALHARSSDSSHDLFSQIILRLSRWQQTYGKKPFYVGGHSLGAAMATLFSAEIAAAQHSGTSPELSPADISGIYTTGEPRSGNTAYACELDRVYAGKHIRFVYYRDWVSAQPLSALGYEHCGLEIYLDKNGTPQRSKPENLLCFSGPDHLPQRYARAIFNLMNTENKLPLGRTLKQTMKDADEVILHPERRKLKK